MSDTKTFGVLGTGVLILSALGLAFFAGTDFHKLSEKIENEPTPFETSLTQPADQYYYMVKDDIITVVHTTAETLEDCLAASLELTDAPDKTVIQLRDGTTALKGYNASVAFVSCIEVPEQ